MKDFEGKVIRMSVDNIQGWVITTGCFIKQEGSFFVIKENNSNKIRYINERYIKNIEIVGDIHE